MLVKRVLSLAREPGEAYEKMKTLRASATSQNGLARMNQELEQKIQQLSDDKSAYEKKLSHYFSGKKAISLCRLRKNARMPCERL